MNKNLKKILSYFLVSKKELALIIILSIILSIFGIIEPFLDAECYNAVAKVYIKEIIFYAIILYVMDIIQNFLYNFLNRLLAKYTNDIELKVQSAITEELFKLEIKNFDREGTNFFITRATSDSKNMVNDIIYLRYDLLSIISSAGVVVYIINASIKIFIVMLISSILLLFVRKKERKLYESKYSHRRKVREYQSSTFTELIRGIKDIKILNLRKTMTEKIINGQNKINKISLEEQKETNKYSIISSIVRETVTLVVLGYALYLISIKELNSSSLLIIYMYHYKVLNLANEVSTLYVRCKDIKLSFKNISDILDNPSYSKERYGSVNKPNFEGLIEFKNVSFSYAGRNLVLKDVNFKIEPNTTIGIVGPSGSGKTTIFNLLSKLYTINQGELLIDNTNINEYTEETLRGNISVISQEPYIFNMSIKENIKIVCPSISDKKLKEICKMVKLDSYIETLPQKYDTLVGENGVILSGGLKQRLAIARALAKKSEIILLDEATSSLDNEKQDEVMEAIKNINKDFTILIIAHRLTTVKDCDKILVVDGGKVSGFDKHEKLIKDNDVYKRLYKKDLL